MTRFFSEEHEANTRRLARPVLFKLISLGAAFYVPGLDTGFIKTDINRGLETYDNFDSDEATECSGPTAFEEDTEVWVDKDALTPDLDLRREFR